MRRILLANLFTLSSLWVCYAQNNEYLGGAHSGGGSTTTPKMRVGDGIGSFGVTFMRQNVCGLNFVQASQIVETRTANDGFNTNGTGLPTSVNLTGLCGANDSIVKAYLYWNTSYFGTFAHPAHVVITNPLANKFFYYIDTIGTDGPKCWNETGTAAYRGDVTTCISGNGSYSINIDTAAGDSSYEVDGVTLLVIYRDPTATYSASLIIWDGEQTSAPGTEYTETFNGFDVCSATTGSAISLLADMQADENGGSNTETFNGTTVTYANDFWNFINISTPLTATQNSVAFDTYTNDHGTDCYSWLMAGLYWQNTNCITCTPLNSFVNITSASATICQGDSILLTGNGGTDYTWSPSTNLNCTICDSTYATPNVTTQYTVSATTVCGSGTDTLTIHVIPSPSITVSPANPGICPGDSVQLIATGATTYTWTPATGLSCSTCANPWATPTATTTYTITAGADGCTGTTSVTVTLGSAPSLTVVPTSGTICSGSSVDITASGATDYTWTPVTGLSCNTCPNPIASPTATTTYTVIASNGGCADTGNVAITVNPTPVLTYTPQSPTVCPGDSIQVTVNGASSYQWLNSSGLSCTTCANPYLNPSVTTVYTVVGTTNGCTDTLDITVTVTTAINVTVSPSSPTICAGSSVTLNGGGANNYNWKPASGLSCTGCANPVASPTTTTTYTVIGSDGGSCEDSAFIMVTVNPLPDVSVSAPDTVCMGQSVTFVASGATSYVWSNGSTNNPLTISPLNNDTTFTVVGFNGTCYDTVRATVDVYPPLTIVMSPFDTICNGTSATLQVYVKGGAPFNYVWNNGITSDSAGPFYVSPATQTTYSCTVTDACGDIATGTTIVTPVARTSNAAFYASPDTILGGGFVNFVNLSTGANSYYWNLGNGSTSSTPDPFIEYNTAGTYIVYLVTTGKYGCIDTATEDIYVTEGVITVPNVFTPNGDGINDVFHVTAGGLQSYNILIYDRWGVEVFESTSPNIDWSGRSYSGVMESAGTYYYVITATDDSGQNYNLKGFVQLVR